jgi:hypothetical protein
MARISHCVLSVRHVLGARRQFLKQCLGFAHRLASHRACFVFGAAIAALLVCLVFSAAASAQTSAPPMDVVVESSAADGLSLDYSLPSDPLPRHLQVTDSALQAKLKNDKLEKGDALSVTIAAATDPSKPAVLQAYAIKSATVPPRRRFLVVVSCAGVYLLICIILTWGKPRRLIIGMDERYSNSKFQIALWFSVLIVSYLAAFWLRYTLPTSFLGGIGIPQNLFVLSGISTLTFGIAKGITTQKVADAAAAGNPAPKGVSGGASIVNDLTHNDMNQIDFGDFQMLVITLLAVIVYLVVLFHFLGSIELRGSIQLPDIDSTILAVFGLGHGAYLTKKAVGPVGQS